MSEMPPIPPLFLERMRRLLGDEYADFEAALAEKPVSGLRVNTLKLTTEEFKNISPFPLGEKVAWCNQAFFLNPTSSPEARGKGRTKEPGKHPYHLAGLYYLQDPSAMSAAALLAPQPGERVLDLSAAPGGKTTALAALMQDKGLLVANEIKDKRLGHLAVNVERWGAGNVVLTNETPERLADHFGAFFDRVLVDAPCSGEGMFRKEASARTDWSPEMVEGCSLRQRNILRLAAKLVRPGGFLLYSTCTFAPEEDEGVIANFLANFPEYESHPLPLFPGFMPGQPEWIKGLVASNSRIQESKKISVMNENLKNTVRLFPHRLKGEGHFICLLKRTGSHSADERPGALFEHQSSRLTKRSIGLWENFASETLRLDNLEQRLRQLGDRLYLVTEDPPDLRGLRVALPGVWLGNIKKDRFEPAHPLALFLKRDQALNSLDLPSAEMDHRGSPLQAYLRGETIPSTGQPGWTLVTVDGWPLGWGKRVQGILKNHYPKGWQIYS